jgi:hypothetical protein
MLARVLEWLRGAFCFTVVPAGVAFLGGAAVAGIG